MARPEKVRLGEILVQQKLLSEEQLNQALADQKRTGRKLGRVFVENGFVTEEQISGALARQLNIPYINQIDSAPRRNDCGPACVVMMAAATN